MMRTWLLIGTFMAIGVASPALGELRVEFDPPDPLTTTPVTVTVANEFVDSCWHVCLVQGYWMSPETYRVLWYIHRESWGTICLPVISTVSSELDLGALEPGDYVVRAEEHVSPTSGWDGWCGFVDDADVVEAPFHVSEAAPVPSVSVWGFMAMAGLVLTAGTVLIHRSLAGARGIRG
jgi:hypothetical protein